MAAAVSAVEVRFQLLGSFQVFHGGQPVSVGGPTAQAVLVGLLQRPSVRLLPEQVVTAVWGSPDGVSDDSLYHYITGLRKALAPLGLEVESCRPGYLLRVPAEAVDAARFEGLVTSARALRVSDPEEAVRRLRAALELWAGPDALGGLGLPGIRRIAAGLDGRRLDAAEDLADLELGRGRAEQVLDLLRTLAAAHPDRDRLTAALIRALHATGRTGQAQLTYLAAEQLARRFGREPHAVVRRAQQDLLGGQPAEAEAGLSSMVPFQLPADTSHFTGRTVELEQILGLVPGRGGTAVAPVACVVDGMAGVGKTALAVHAAHRLASRFPDGSLFIDLHGFTPETTPATPQKALDTLLRGLGVTGQQIPPDLDARAALYRSQLARRRMLIVLDNAKDEAQVRPLLPGTPGCLVLVTSRRRLAGLDDAQHLSLDTLSPQEAAALFRAVASDGAWHDHRTVDEIVQVCGELPLAIRIAAARLRTSRAMTPTALLASLRREHQHDLPLRGLNDGERSVAAAFAVSYHHLEPAQRHAFGLLGVHPGPSIDAYATAALLDGTLPDAQRFLDALEQVNLIVQPTQDRYRFHDLLRAYATDAAVQDSRLDHGAALGRLLDHYSHATSVAMDTLYAYEAPYRPRISPPHTPAPDLAEPEAARRWLQEELPNLLAAAEHATVHGHLDHAAHTVHLSATLARHLRTLGRYADAYNLHTHALNTARTIGDQVGELTILIALARTDRVADRHAEAAGRYHEALRIARHVDHHAGEIGALTGLGHVRLMTRANTEAHEHLAHALQLARQTGHRPGEIDARWGLGQVHRASGHYDQATGQYQQALDLAREIGHRAGEVIALTGLGHVHRQLGSYSQAIAHLQQALGIAVDTGDRSAEIYALLARGHVYRLTDRPELAIEDYHRALGIARDIGDRNGRFQAQHALGQVLRETGQATVALTHHQDALDTVRTLAQPHDEARAHNGLAHTHLTLGQPTHARAHWHAALAIYTRLNDPHATQIQAHLDNLTPQPV
ncbi:MAG TPA: tetratricopeptide repeat protein [Mycobacteriales bacterium]|nr:tetratricopeptide repeat protein [Mycobacteriales bacterium]